MGVFSGLEGSLEKYIEGFFKGKYKGHVEPAEIAKRLAREMRDHRRVSVNKIYVPNLYKVHLSSPEYDQISTLVSALTRELQDYVQQKAIEKRYTLTGPPAVSFDNDSQRSAGSIEIESGFSETPPEDDRAVAEKTPLEQTQKFRLNKDNLAMNQTQDTSGRLRIEDGPDRGKCFNLGKETLVLGRRAGCDIVFKDSSVSRRHAQIEWHRGQYTITDLGSTNGTKVNGVKVTARVLEPGDKLALGTTICAFKVE
ncbi:MAG: Oxoglutarate dehydrogenase inhibitor [Pelotomaculum sp. PtaB.Bin104]|nr:MAG: Oxoglutarate dehydrogenase inhibitor [Pelotomaculum sp. PtaB.Bin104]